MTFLILDGLLGWPVKLYDASWIEWGYLADEAKMGVLDADSPWRTDCTAADAACAANGIPVRSEAIHYNVDFADPVRNVVEPPGGEIDSFSPRADLITVIDDAFGGGPGGGGFEVPGY